MAATDVLSLSPLTPGQAASWNGFDDFLDLPSPLGTPRIAPASTAANSMANQSRIVPASSEGGAPPPPNSSPEILFRYYLAAELRRIGSPVDDAIIDRYVSQHYDSFTRAMERHQANAAINVTAPATATQLADGSLQRRQAFRSPPPAVVPMSDLSTASIDPHLVELKSSIDSLSMSNHASQTASEHSQPSPSYASDENDVMSNIEEADEGGDDDEDEDEDIKSDVKGKDKKKLTRAVEETPIEGSIMGPANELRPDPETYRKLSSKEKRQLRNKISARNFRTRRKEHIGSLEQQVAERDITIEGLRKELARVHLHNKDLQEEIRSLKVKAISSSDVSRIIDALQKSTMPTNEGTTPLAARTASSSSLQDVVMSGVRPSSPSRSSSSSIAKPNLRKDVPGTPSGASSSRGFWGGANVGSNYMSVHTVLVPAPSDAVNDLALLTKKLTIDNEQENAHNAKDSEVNAALVSLVNGEDEIAPPSYNEATAISAPPSQATIHAAVLSAVNMPAPGASCKATLSQSVAARRLEALADGRARLMLVDASGQPWKDQECFSVAHETVAPTAAVA